MIEDTKCEIITVGTELLLGQINDTNSTWLSNKLAEAGINVYYKQTVGDNFNRLFSVFEKAQERSNIIFVTGGLGPTDDDLTKEVAAKLFNCELDIHQPTLNKIESFFKRRQQIMTENNRKQAQCFPSGRVFENEVGMAPGLHMKHEGASWFFLPGVPKEMKWIIDEQILPYLKDEGLLTKQLYSRVLSFQGIGESALETELQDIIRAQTNPTIAPLAGNGYVTLRITARAITRDEGEQLISDLEESILNRVGSYFVGYGQISLEVGLMQLLKEKQLTLSSCESVTGGLFASTIIQHDGASSIFNGSIVSYTNKVKQHAVGVPEHILREYGAVSEPCADAMAEHTRKQLQSDIAISFTGIAGTEPVNGYPPGTVFIGISNLNQTIVRRVQLKGNRNAIREEAVTEGIKHLIRFIKNFN
ncbi:competence/damage-inducible protein A [Tenuibacillus multivorans]|uniref:Putative competence-damage inducible protein n=1 Tax=Tenuibacillus multivorans TaxID=237069 RepID=A0A1G9XU14_9BACI|nr:competence/damage-inducible protein A [Tenuibacillus multivorans]GEL75807.1 putative competence-damage inducible protein [Tenuibacillus multivorans]SDM99981.1 nicotinamide-nucleotide amidase [Tenuibacillus multivorans]